jgi:hypothetical protein
MFSTMSSTTKHTQRDFSIISPTSSPRGGARITDKLYTLTEFTTKRNTSDQIQTIRVNTDGPETRITTPIPKVRYSKTSEAFQRISKTKVDSIWK